MTLPVIEADQPVIEPAVASKTYDALWLRNVQVVTPFYGVGSVYIETVPMVSGTGEVHPSESVEVRSDQLWAAAAAVPEVATAIGAILAAFPPLKAWIASQQG